MTNTTTLEDLRVPMNILFKQIASVAIKAGQKGRCLFLYKNEELETESKFTTYKNTDVINLADEKLNRYVKQLFNGGTRVVHVIEYKTDMATIQDMIDDLVNQYDWLMCVEANEQTNVANYAKNNKKFACVYNVQADSIYVCSIANPSAVLINDDGTTTDITGLDLIPVIGGVACGCPYDMSISYKIFNELKEVAQPDEYRQGQLTLYAEEEGIRLANACNTLQTVNATYTEDMKALTIAECMYRIENDTIKCFRQGYKGKFKNSYSNQCLFYSAFNYGYIKELERLEVLDASYDNFIETHVENQRNSWLAKGNKEASDWGDDKVRQMTRGNVVYARIHAKLLDAMEGFDIVVEMA